MSDTESDVPRALGARNPRIAELRRLISGQRSRSDYVLLEGPRTVGEALKEDVLLLTVVVPETALSGDAVDGVLSQLDSSVDLVVVLDHVFESLAPSVTPQPMLAIAERPVANLPASVEAGDLVLVLVDVADPGNLGTIVRVADAFAAKCVVAIGGCDPWSSKAVRASAGSVLRVSVVAAEDLDATLSSLRSAGATIIASDVREGVPPQSVGLDGGVAMVLGSESHGLDRAIEPLVDYWVSIEMSGTAESLNVAMAATLLAYEARRDGS